MDSAEKVRENRLRRALERRGYALMKSRQRDPNGLLFGTYQIVDPKINGVVWADFVLQRGYGLSLDDVEAWLDGD